MKRTFDGVGLRLHGWRGIQVDACCDERAIFRLVACLGGPSRNNILIFIICAKKIFYEARLEEPESN